MSTATAFGLTVSVTPKKVTTTIAMDPGSTLTKKTRQLRSLLSLTYGESDETFRGMALEIQDEVMWLAHELASEVHLLATLVDGNEGGAA